VVAREARTVAQVLAFADAVAAFAARPPQPRDTEPASILGRADDLVPDDERELRLRQLAVDYVEVRAADAAGVDTEEHLARPRLGLRQLRLAEQLPGRF
jgi:hypothetical protein